MMVILFHFFQEQYEKVSNPNHILALVIEIRLETRY